MLLPCQCLACQVGFCISGPLTRETVTFPFFSQTLVEAMRNARKDYVYKMEVTRR